MSIMSRSRVSPASSANSLLQRCLSTAVSYPHLLQHEQSLSLSATARYDVAAWLSYLDAMDDALDALRSALQQVQQQRGPPVEVSVAGRIFPLAVNLQSLANLERETCHMVRARIILGERAVSLLPGSYKLWKNHLMFCKALLERPTVTLSKDWQTQCQIHRLPLYLLHSDTPHQEHYWFTLAAFERSLVRLHKMPRLWLMYAAFVSIYDPHRNPTTVRKIYDRMMLALPITQHDRVWEELLCWVTGILPNLSTTEDATNLSEGTALEGKITMMSRRRGMHKVKYGFESPLIEEWRKRGWAYSPHSQESSRYLPTVPTETALRILRRYALYYDTTYREDLANLCIVRYQRFGEAAELLLQLLNNESLGNTGGGGAFVSANGTTRHELWLRFADVCTSHPKEAKVAGVDFNGIVRAVLKGHDLSGAVGGAGVEGLGYRVFDKTPDALNSIENEDKESTASKVVDHRLGEMEGTLWTRLAEYHVRAGDFELARSVYEEALDAITRVRDFSLVFDAYVSFEEGVIAAMMELMEEEDGDVEVDIIAKDKSTLLPTDAQGLRDLNDDDQDLDILLETNSLQNVVLNHDSSGTSADVELAISRAEHLTFRRPFLLNRVLLRQNPHNVGEWLKRSQLYLDSDEVGAAASTLEEALNSISSRKAVNGSPSTVVLTLIGIHENTQNDVDAARNVLERICSKNEYEFQDTEDLAQCHAAWVEMELRHENWDTALNLARRAVSGNIGGKKGGSKALRGLSRSLRLWNLLFDLEESLGTVQTTKDAYDRAMELKVVTPSHILNYASFLKDKKYFEESFAAYERGLSLFPFPHPGAILLWKKYLTNFLERYDGSKTPRVRELFDCCLADCPPEHSPEFFLLYGDYEEKHGLTKRALGVYERMCNSVLTAEKYTAFRLYIAKTIQYLGITTARPIFEHAISALEDGPASRICLEYAKMETGLREIDRARTVLIYGAQLADPRRDPDYWSAWHEFEVSHGNEETFREMLRVKRSVQAAFSTVNYNAAEMGSGAPQVETLTEESALEMIAEREGMTLNEKPLIGGFVQGKRTAEIADLGEVERRAARLRQATGVSTSSIVDDEIDIDNVDDDEELELQTPRESDSVKIPRGVMKKAIPSAVFGGITASGNSGD